MDSGHSITILTFLFLLLQTLLQEFEPTQAEISLTENYT